MPPKRRRPVIGRGVGQFPNAACRHKQKVIQVDIPGKVPEFLENQGMTIVHYRKTYARGARMSRTKPLTLSQRKRELFGKAPWSRFIPCSPRRD